MSAESGLGLRRWGRLALSDVLASLRDPMLALVICMCLLVPVLLAVFRDALVGLGGEGLPRLIAPSAMMMAPALIGWVLGFLVLEDRDEGTLLALAVTPVGQVGVLVFRLVVAAGLSALLALVILRAVVPDASIAECVASLLLCGLAGVLSAAVLPALARNKVEGLALTKVSNLAILVPLAALLPFPWRYLFAWLPSYWLGEALLVADGAPLSVSALAGSALSAAIVLLLLRRFTRRAG